ncbi:MAG TPA: hypothetical protein VGO18_14105 [Steroidobacteraceae bacterium]|nr:hypothetical protein [Steroidobacteraceae bacterium]
MESAPYRLVIWCSAALTDASGDFYISRTNVPGESILDPIALDEWAYVVGHVPDMQFLGYRPSTRRFGTVNTSTRRHVGCLRYARVYTKGSLGRPATPCSCTPHASPCEVSGRRDTDSEAALREFAAVQWPRAQNPLGLG